MQSAGSMAQSIDGAENQIISLLVFVVSTLQHPGAQFMLLIMNDHSVADPLWKPVSVESRGLREPASVESRGLRAKRSSIPGPVSNLIHNEGTCSKSRTLAERPPPSFQ